MSQAGDGGCTCECLTSRRATLKTIGILDIFQYLGWFSYGIYLIHVEHTPIIKEYFADYNEHEYSIDVNATKVNYPGASQSAKDPITGDKNAADDVPNVTDSPNNSTANATEVKPYVDNDTMIESILIGLGSTGVAGGICLTLGVYLKSRKLCRLCQLSICTRFFSNVSLCILFGMEEEWLLFTPLVVANILYYWTWGILSHFMNDIKGDFINGQAQNGFATFTEIQQAYNTADTQQKSATTTSTKKHHRKHRKSNTSGTDSTEVAHSSMPKANQSTELIICCPQNL